MLFICSARCVPYFAGFGVKRVHDVLIEAVLCGNVWDSVYDVW